MFDFCAEAAGALPCAGVDEVGRGPWAGPIVAAAAILDPARLPPGLDDSKKLTPARRQRLCAAILAVGRIGIGEATVAEIEALGLIGANDLAMRRAVDALPAPPRRLLIDGNRVPPGLDIPAEAVIRGDGSVLSIAAASIVAKVTRDRTMAALADEFPGYGWERNAGYGTAEHRAGLARLGITPHHRRGFRPIHNILCGSVT